MGRFGRFGSKLVNHEPFWSIWVQIDQSRAVLVDFGPNWSIRGRFGRFGSKLVDHGPFRSIRVQIGQSRAVLVGFGPNRPITVRFSRSGSKLVNHGPFWSIRVQICQSWVSPVVTSMLNLWTCLLFLKIAPEHPHL